MKNDISVLKILNTMRLWILFQPSVLEGLLSALRWRSKFRFPWEVGMGGYLVTAGPPLIPPWLEGKGCLIPAPLVASTDMMEHMAAGSGENPDSPLSLF